MTVAPTTTLKALVVTTSNTWVYDPDKIAALHEQLAPDPDQYGEDPAYAVWAYLSESLFGADVFEDQGDFDQGYTISDYTRLGELKEQADRELANLCMTLKAIDDTCQLLAKHGLPQSVDLGTVGNA